MKTEVYSWRLSTQKKTDLEYEARREQSSVADLLEQITSDWLEQRRSSRPDEEAEQATIRARAAAAIGSLSGGDPSRSSNASPRVREIIRSKHERQRAR